jgi:hypothetical protein
VLRVQYIGVLKKTLGAGLDASKEVGLEVNTMKTGYIFLSRHQNSGRNHNINITDKTFENVEALEYLGVVVSHKGYIHEEIKNRLNFGNACYHAVQIFVFLSAI